MNITKNQQIIDGIIAGDSSILKSFYKKNLPLVRRLILKYNGTTEDVEDIFQEALVLLYHKLKSGELDVYTSIHSYFIGICKNMWRNQLRKKRISEYYQLCEKSTPDPSDSIIDTITKEHQQNLFNKHLDNLSKGNKSILKLFFEEKSNRDIANITGCSEGYTRKKKCIIKERLQKMVQSDPVYGELVTC
ncbi:sigma-70 family RNA polymerase sigma factor [Aquimarina sp. BL5]|uniref:RNA polymerase sigma factor n=1 Tax=Aquimarina sp. BL5 TaxID=1714860 RepID=UPI000E4DDAF5|nr:sigma-70 family RNA polymerase sigma factor [Aquimarina sp. BL5]AXT51319.1 sigma-70 family RNA polymerase sigma factor [Aquimarina sp. BL5]